MPLYLVGRLVETIINTNCFIAKDQSSSAKLSANDLFASLGAEPEFHRFTAGGRSGGTRDVSVRSSSLAYSLRGVDSSTSPSPQLQPGLVAEGLAHDEGHKLKRGGTSVPYHLAATNLVEGNDQAIRALVASKEDHILCRRNSKEKKGKK